MMKCHELHLPFLAPSLVTGTHFKGVNPTFIAGILLTHISRLSCIDSSQTPARCLGAKAALSLGGPGTEEHRELRKEDCLDCSKNKWAGLFSNLVTKMDNTVAPNPPRKKSHFLAVRKQKLLWTVFCLKINMLC